MHIAFGADNPYAQHLGITIASLLANLKAGIEPHIYIVTDGISDENKQKISALKSIRNFHLQYINVSLDDFKDFPLISDHITIATYFRLKLPYLLPDLSKVIYLDTDLIVDQDISPLWDLDLSDNDWLAAAAEPGMKPEFLETIGMVQDDFYFNAGVIVMNLAAMRANGFENHCAEFVRQYRNAIVFVDQDVLNHVCRNHVKWFDPKFNLVYSYLDKIHKLDRYHTPYTMEQKLNAVTNPAIIHFTGALKPWHYASRNKFSYKYMAYLKLTPWKNYQFQDKNFKNFKSKNLFFFRQWVKRVLGQ